MVLELTASEILKLGKNFRNQKSAARKRGIGWELTFDEWIQVWVDSGHLADRGRHRGQYQMARYGDVGPYSISNVQIKTSSANLAERDSKQFRGSKNGLSKLTDEQVLAIRAAEGTEPRQATADRFGLNYSYVASIQNRRSWSWLEGPPRPTDRRRGGAYSPDGGFANLSLDERRANASKGGRASAAVLDDPTRRSDIMSKRSAGAQASWDAIRADPDAYKARRARHRTADHQSPKARENHRKAALLREAHRRASRVRPVDTV